MPTSASPSGRLSQTPIRASTVAAQSKTCQLPEEATLTDSPTAASRRTRPRCSGGREKRTEPASRACTQAGAMARAVSSSRPTSSATWPPSGVATR